MKTPTERTIETWHDAIRKGGSTSIKMRRLLGHYGAKRRGARLVEEIREHLASLSPSIHVFGLDDLGATLDSTVTLTYEPIRTIGSLWDDTEASLKDEHESALMKALGLKLIQREYSPEGTRDRFDYLCKDRKGVPVIVEVKRRDGERRGVEQLLRYIGQLKRAEERSARGILVTGVSDLQTRDALRGRDHDRHIRWFLYGFNEAGELIVEEESVER